jgi:hypothetical protein
MIKLRMISPSICSENFNASQGQARLAPFSNLKLELEGLVNVVMGLRFVCYGLDSPAHLITIRTTNQTKQYLITYVKVLIVSLLKRLRRRGLADFDNIRARF